MELFPDCGRSVETSEYYHSSTRASPCLGLPRERSCFTRYSAPHSIADGYAGDDNNRRSCTHGCTSWDSGGNKRLRFEPERLSAWVYMCVLAQPGSNSRRIGRKHSESRHLQHGALLSWNLFICDYNDQYDHSGLGRYQRQHHCGSGWSVARCSLGETC
jgi:hypothetical protein